MKKENTHIGNLIKSVITQKSLKNAEVARNAGITPQRLNNWLNKDDIYVKDLFRLCKALNYDFFEPFRLPKEEMEQETKITLQIEIPSELKSDVMKFIRDKSLQDLLLK